MSVQPAPATFAFLVHPRTALAADLARVWRPLGAVPDGALAWALRHLPLPALPLATVHADPGPLRTGTGTGAVPDGAAHRSDRLTSGSAPLGHVLVVPATPRQLLTDDRAWVRGRLESAIDRAQDLGASVVGLGALTSPASGAGRLLRPRPGLAVTTGNAFTAVLTIEGLRRAAPAVRGGHLAIIGATGSVGECVVRLLAADPLPFVTDVTLVARGAVRLDALAAEVTRSGAPFAVRTSTSLDAVRDAGLVLVLTSATDALLRSAHLAPGAVVLDDTQPRNTDPSLAYERPDVLVLDGGIAAVPGLRIRGDIGLPHGLAYACLCETVLMALEGATTSAVGPADVNHALALRDAARRHGALGFTLAEPALSFGRPVAWPDTQLTSAAPGTDECSGRGALVAADVLRPARSAVPVGAAVGS